MLNALAFIARVFNNLLEFFPRDHTICYQAVKLADHFALNFFRLVHALADRGTQRFTQLGNAFHLQFAERLITLVIDDLQNAVKGIALHHRCDQHLAGTVAGTLVDLFQKSQRRVNLFQRGIIVDVGQINELTAESHIPGQTLRRNRQLQVAAAVQTGFNFGNNCGLIVGDRIQS